LAFGVSKVELAEFVGSDRLVAQFLGKYQGKPRTYEDYGRALAMFFKWLRIEGFSFTPTEFLNECRTKSLSHRVEDLDWALGLVLRFTRDNPVWRDCADRFKLCMFIKVKQFFDRYRVPLSLQKGVFGKARRRKYSPKQMTVDSALKVLSCLRQRERAVCMTMFQSGQSVDAILNYFNPQYEYLMACLKNGQKRIRLDFPERKGNGFAYFSFVSTDAIQELRKWLIIREKWLTKKGKASTYIFVTNNGEPLTVKKFEVKFYRAMKRTKLSPGPFMLTSHMFRKLFKTESSPPDRGVSADYVEFMMGHMSGIESVGGVYDRTPEIYEEVVEREYGKIEPFLNIYTGVKGKLSEKQRLSDEILELLNNPNVLRRLAELAEKNPL
jgi:integrase